MFLQIKKKDSSTTPDQSGKVSPSSVRSPFVLLFAQENVIRGMDASRISRIARMAESLAVFHNALHEQQHSCTRVRILGMFRDIASPASPLSLAIHSKQVI
ncbi:hypothetical protein CDAR_295091 [Caerostris darwini]|uniref:Uncharacterized protein n=1 Tax=Caerostris darwini TaxID=1538125 RepID=A0AAV4UKJ0_9ARAC|nr:hypothetical protein CDAR_295091 [Caerostris darwini]